MNDWKNNKGFSLVELMVVVGIIAVLAALAVPRFQVFQAKGKQTEAKTNLTYIYTLEESYLAENDEYANMELQGKGVGCSANDLGLLSTLVKILKKSGTHIAFKHKLTALLRQQPQAVTIPSCKDVISPTPGRSTRKKN